MESSKLHRDAGADTNQWRQCALVECGRTFILEDLGGSIESPSVFGACLKSDLDDISCAVRPVRSRLVAVNSPNGCPVRKSAPYFCDHELQVCLDRDIDDRPPEYRKVRTKQDLCDTTSSTRDKILHYATRILPLNLSLRHSSHFLRHAETLRCCCGRVKKSSRLSVLVTRAACGSAPGVRNLYGVLVVNRLDCE